MPSRENFFEVVSPTPFTSDIGEESESMDVL